MPAPTSVIFGEFFLPGIRNVVEVRTQLGAGGSASSVSERSRRVVMLQDKMGCRYRKGMARPSSNVQ